MSELKPCPFCGGAAQTIRLPQVPGLPSWAISCDHDEDCLMEQAQGYVPMHDTKVGAITAWNTRTPAPTSDNAMLTWLVAQEVFRTTNHAEPEPNNQAAARIIQQYGDQCEAVKTNEFLSLVAQTMGEFVDNWPEPKKPKTALALVAKALRAALNKEDAKQAEATGFRRGVEAAAKVADYQATISGCTERRTARLGLRRKAYFTEIGREVNAAILALLET